MTAPENVVTRHEKVKNSTYYPRGTGYPLASTLPWVNKNFSSFHINGGKTKKSKNVLVTDEMEKKKRKKRAEARERTSPNSSELEQRNDRYVFAERNHVVGVLSVHHAPCPS